MRNPKNRWIVGLCVLLMWMALAFMASAAYAPPQPRPATIPDTEFSAARAWETLTALVGDNIPHPTGSEQNRVVCERLLSILRDLGYAPQVQTTDVTYKGKTTTIHNILVRRPGSHPGPAVMLVAHYDSVPPGPGASDDAASVAVLMEIARMLHAAPPARNDLI